MADEVALMVAVATYLDVDDWVVDLADVTKGDEVWKPFTTRDVVLEMRTQAVTRRMILLFHDFAKMRTMILCCPRQCTVDWFSSKRLQTPSNGWNNTQTICVLSNGCRRQQWKISWTASVVFICSSDLLHNSQCSEPAHLRRWYGEKRGRFVQIAVWRVVRHSEDHKMTTSKKGRPMPFQNGNRKSGKRSSDCAKVCV